MNLKELRDEIKRLRKLANFVPYGKMQMSLSNVYAVYQLESIKQTVEAVDNSDAFKGCSCENCLKEWQEIKELLKAGGK